MLGHGPQHRGWQKQERPDKENRTEEDESKGDRVCSERPHRVWSRLLRRQTRGKGDWCNDRNEPPEQHYQATSDVPLGAERRRRRRVLLGLVEAIRVRQPLKAGCVVGRGRRALV